MKFKSDHKYQLIKEIESLNTFFRNGLSLKNCTFQDIDFTKQKIDWCKYKINNTTFLGCTFEYEDEILLLKKSAYIYPKPKNLPYNPFRKSLYLLDR